MLHWLPQLSVAYIIWVRLLIAFHCVAVSIFSIMRADLWRYFALVTLLFRLNRLTGSVVLSSLLTSFSRHVRVCYVCHGDLLAIFQFSITRGSLIYFCISGEEYLVDYIYFLVNMQQINFNKNMFSSVVIKCYFCLINRVLCVMYKVIGKWNLDLLKN